MKQISGVKSKWVVIAVAVAGGLVADAAIAAGSTLKSGNISQLGMWYGRAGGLVGPDRVAHLEGNATNTDIAVTYDKDVAARTNMASDRDTSAPVTISYDKDVAERTNLPRGVDLPPIQSAQTDNK